MNAYFDLYLSYLLLRWQHLGFFTSLLLFGISSHLTTPAAVLLYF